MLDESGFSSKKPLALEWVPPFTLLGVTGMSSEKSFIVPAN
jgi:hypothetical protein